MKTIDDYTVYCTEAQTKKALELGAPIEYDSELPSIVLCPTAEQMIGWLRSKGFRFKITEFEEGTLWKVAHGDWFDFSDDDGVNPKEATLAAIDAALEYLMNKKKSV